MRRFLAHHGFRIAILAQAEVAGLAQDAVLGPVLEGHLDDELGFHPVPDLAAALVGQAVEGTVLALELLHPRMPLGAFPGAESAAHAPGVAQRVVAAADADQQRRERARSAPR